MNNLNIFQKSKITGILLVINVVVFIIMTLAGGTNNTSNLLRFGAMNKILVANGEWYRIFTSSFIHIGFFHLLFNMYFLYNIGPLFERLYGPRNFLIMYLLSGIMGNLMSYAFSDMYTVSAGASTSLYGMFGFAIGIMIHYKDNHMLRNFGASFLSIIAINLIYSLLSPSVGLLGHLGGFISGIILVGIFPIRGYEIDTLGFIFSTVAYIALVILFIIIGNRSLYL